jgi:hypothetical protein
VHAAAASGGTARGARSVRCIVRRGRTGSYGTFSAEQHYPAGPCEVETEAIAMPAGPPAGAWLPAFGGKRFPSDEKAMR